MQQRPETFVSHMGQAPKPTDLVNPIMQTYCVCWVNIHLGQFMKIQANWEQNITQC